MVLIDSHTISKSIDNDEKVDDIFDSINDLDHTRNPRLRRDRFQHKYRVDYKDEYVRPADVFKDTRLYAEAERTTEKTSPKTTIEHTKHHKSPKRRVGSFWRKFRGKDKKNKHDSNQRKRRIPKHREFASKYPTTKDFRNSGPRSKSRRKNRNQFTLRQSGLSFAKRDLSGNIVHPKSTNRGFSRLVVYSTRTSNTPRPAYKLQIGIAPQIDNMDKDKFRINTIKPERVTEGVPERVTERVTERFSEKTDSLSSELATMTTQISHLKEIYGIERYNPNSLTVSPAYDKSEANYPPPTTTTQKTTEADFPGTAQIEELLNDIKFKAIQMVSEQNPLVTDIITNTVTEATFEADPILTHIGMAAPGFYLSTFVSINDIASLNEKRTVSSTETNEFNLNNTVLITNTESHYLAARSIKEDTMTLAHNVEDMLQRELKNIYNKVKHKVSSDFRKEVHKAKSTIKETISKVTSSSCKTKKTTTPTTTTCTTTCPPKPKECPCKNAPEKLKAKSTTTTAAPRHTRGGGKNRKDHNDTPEPEAAIPKPTYDDYMMLTLYEQMLAKTHEDNVRKMLATTDLLPYNKKRRENFRLSKRNPETLTDVKLREVIQKLYDDGVTMPDYDYIDPSANVTSTGQSSTPEINMDDNIDPTGTMGNSAPINMGDPLDLTQNNVTTPMSSVTDSNLSDTSFEGLSNKISYNDFVNGYKHYLKFQKEQSNQNFSNLIKYQAHRHHSVDDIGKFILNKIPPLPSRQKRFFDNTDIEYQEITTKSDDSWFRKHFYLFIDNGPPKKFHTSQTVELKSAITEHDTKAFMTDPVPRQGFKDQAFIRIGSDDTTRNVKDTSELSLDDLAKILDSIKDKQSASPFFRGVPKAQNGSFIGPPISNYNSTDENTIIQIRMLPQSFIGKLFGSKRRRAPKRLQRITTEYFPAIDMFTENPLKRLRRTVTNEDHENTIMDDFMNKDLEEKLSTGAKEIFTDTAARSSNKETNKYGYLDIDLVPRQTAVVKLRENPKKSRFKNFFKKFHFKRNKTKTKHAKRSCYYDTNVYNIRRRTRFNPIKKLKDIFRARVDDKEDSPVFRLPNMPDYDMMTSHIETFKPIKYDKPMTIDEMQKQIPNISEVLNFDSLTTKHTTRLSSFLFRLDDNDRNLLYNYHMPSHVATKTMLGMGTAWLEGGIAFTGVSSVYKAKQAETTTKTQATTTITPTTTKGQEKQKIPPSNVMTVNVKTLKPATTPSTTRSIKTETTALMTLDDINFILNKIQYKLQKSSRNFPRISTPHYKRGNLNSKKNSPLLQCKRPHEELTIKSKLTRIAKFPISKRHFKIIHDDSQQINDGNDYLSFHDGPLIKEYIHQMRNRNASPEKKKTANMKKLNRPNLTKLPDSQKCRYTDYFNDLLMWHNDILNLDKVPNPIWKNILKNIQSESGESYTTPNMNNLLRELNEINDFLDEGNSLNKLTVTSSANASMNVGPRPHAGNTGVRSLHNLNSNNQDVIRSVAMDDSALVSSKDLIIKGEAKYYQYNKPKIIDSQLKSSDFIRKLNKLKVYKNDYERNAKVKGELKRSQSPPTYKNEPAILLDTTIMAYDDEADSVTKGLEVKKLSRNSQKSTKAAPTKNRPMNLPSKMLNGPFLKKNKAPMQYYTTPLPMKSSDFNKFLKDNKLDVESVTSPMLELPSINDNWTGPPTKSTFTETTDHIISGINATIKMKKIELTTVSLKGITQNPLDNSIKFRNKLVKPSPVLSQSKPNTKNTFLDDFDRYKRYSELVKLPANSATVKPNNKPTQEFNYYNMIKKKMKERLFEKKANAGAVERPTSDPFTVDPHNKEVEITIINFDDLDKITTPQPYENYALPSPSSIKKEDNAPFPDFTDRPAVTSEIPLPKSIEFMQKEEMHNGLLYKDIFKERTTSTSTDLSTLADFTKSTEYVDPIVNDLPTGTVNKLRYPFDKMPQMYPNILGKMPHPKNFNVPKRVHISSHHYKYDIFYDDNKKTAKSAFEVFRPKHGSLDLAAAPNEMRQQIKLTNVRSPTSENGEAKIEVIKKIDRTAKRNRYARGASATEKTNKHRLFTWRGCKPKPEGGLSAPGEDLESPVRASSQDNAVRVSTQHEDTMSSIHANGSTASSPSASTAEVETIPGSLVYDLKHLRRTTSSTLDKERDKDRHRRLFKISAMIQDRFKNLMKNFTTVKHTESTKRGPKSNTKCTCNCTCKASTEEETKPTTEKDEVEEIDKELEKDFDGFRITCGPSEGPEPKTTTTTLTTTTEEIRTTSRHQHYHYHYHHHNHHYQDDDYAVPEEKEQHRPIDNNINNNNTSYNEFKYKGHVLHDLPNDTLYVEPETYNDQAYYEIGPLQRPPTTQVTEEPDFYGKHYDIKRDVQTQNTFTAKDVAALEVIVDLMKNTLSYEEKDIASVFHNTNFILPPQATKSTIRNEGTNSIQVHIAIPSDFQTGKKRSPLDPVRVRKVFSAKMSTPVDLEYQVHSFEGAVSPTTISTSTPTSTSTSTSASTSSKSTTSSCCGHDALSPGMYLLIDKPRNGYALRPVKAKINISELKTRQVAAETTASMSESKPTETREETTSLKSLAKVTLSKDFIAVINKQLIEMYENASKINNEVPNKPRMGRSVWKSHKIKEEKEGKRCTDKYICKRRIDWEAVKKYFGHDRVCNCKCKTNKAMCRACAASDAVIDELIFEFDNIGRYMKDHCTEIQTFFWMNPSGGQKLRDAVSRIDKSLEDYYKRVKGKCQGRTCKTFTTYIDKRQIVKTSKVLKQDVFTHLINDLASVAEDINKTISLKACFNNKLKEEGEKFVHTINNCIMKKSFDKRSNPNTTKKKLIKNVYSLDNINVNIICNPEVTSTPDEYEHTATTITSHQDSTPRLADHLFEYDLDENKPKKHRGLKKLFPRKNKKAKLFTYFVTDNTKRPRPYYKREINNNAAKPLISDGGGAFWYDYLKASTNEPRIVRDSIRDKSNIEIAVVQKDDSEERKIHKIAEKPRSKDPIINTIYMTVKTTPKRQFLRETEATTDYLTHNINQLLQLFGSLQDIESMNMHSNRSTMFLTHSTASQKETTEKTTTKQTTKCVKKVKTKMLYKGDAKEETATQAMHNSTSSTTTSSTSKTTPNIESKLDSVTLNPSESIETKITGTSNQNSTSADTDDTPTTINLNESIIIRDTTSMTHNVTNITTPKIKETEKTLATTSNTKKITSSHTTVTQKPNENLDTKPLVDNAESLKQTTTTSSFLGKLKTATLRFFDNLGQKSTDATEASSTIVTDPPLTTIVDKISTTEMEAVDLSSQITTHMSPTIVIINEYDNQISNDVLNDPNKESEGYKNLLLSIIQYETNKLNDEWHRIAYGGVGDEDGDTDENDIKRSVIEFSKAKATTAAKTSNPKPKAKAQEDEYDVLQGVKSLNNLELPDPDTEARSTKKPEGLLNKIVSKMGIKVVSGTKKKAAKKPTVREATKKKKVRNRKLRINNWKVENPAMSRFNEKACDTHRSPESTQICDIQATFGHITDLQKTLPTEEFENLVKNISCYRYKSVDSEFFIPFKRKGKRWDWIRNKRCLKLHFSRVKEESELDDEAEVLNFDDDSNDSFERFVKGDNGIYKIIKRKKRTVSLETLDLGLRNIPPLMPGENELYVMVGDSVTLDCAPHTSAIVSDSKFRWKTDRKRMLKQDNVEVDGIKITIHNVEPRNVGTYTCSLDHTVQRNVRLSVMTVPAFDVVFLPFYKTEDICSYDDLNAIQRLGTLMSKENRCGKCCSIRIDEPVCQRDRGTNSSLIRSTAVISMTPLDVNCSLQCRRDIVSSLVMLCATNTPVLSSIGVVLSKDGVNETLTPWKEFVRPVVTHTLRKKDTNGHHEYHKLVSSLSPGKVDVVLNCPAGYYLLPEYKICSSCPPNTSSKSGDNTCRSCPRGTRADPGAAKCHAVTVHPRRYDWWWYPPCGYLVACCGVVFGCTVCVLLSLIMHVVSRYTDPREEEVCCEEQEITPKTETSVTAAYAHTPRTRPLSPSRVILPRFFKPSLTSSRATDSQETKFELWKERNIPPPLPPIDFDI